MPKKPFKKHVKFSSFDNADEAGTPGRGQMPTATVTATPGPMGYARMPVEIEIRIQDENGELCPHISPEEGTEDDSGCSTLPSPTHGRQGRLMDLTADGDGRGDLEEEEEDGCGYCPQEGPHVALLTLCCVPFVFVLSLIVAGYLGVLTWYNIFLCYYDDRGWIHRLLVCPLLVLVFLPLVVVAAAGVAAFAACRQLAWSLAAWRGQVTDLEKGFYAWLCQRLGLAECTPYEVITLDDEDEDDFGRTTPHAISAV